MRDLGTFHPAVEARCKRLNSAKADEACSRQPHFHVEFFGASEWWLTSAITENQLNPSIQRLNTCSSYRFVHVLFQWFQLDPTLSCIFSFMARESFSISSALRIMLIDSTPLSVPSSSALSSVASLRSFTQSAVICLWRLALAASKLRF